VIAGWVVLTVTISMAGGFVRGHEPGEEGLRAYPLHRITAVTVISDPDTDT
jgi:hypothetical protein